MGDSLVRKPLIGDAETAGSVDQPAAPEVADAGPQSAESPVEASNKARGAIAQEAVTERISLRGSPPATMDTRRELKVPEPLDTSRVLAKGSYLSSQVGLLLSKYTRIRSDLLVACRSGLVGEDLTYGGRVTDYLRLAKHQLESRRPNLPVTADLLLGADRSMVWLYDRNILLQRCDINVAKLDAIDPRPATLIRNLDSAKKVMEKSPSTMADDAFRSALLDALSRIHMLEREDIVEEDLQARRLKILIVYLGLALLLLLAAIPFTTTVMREPPIPGQRRDVIWPILYSEKLHILALVSAALGLAAIGAAGGIISGMLKVRDSPARLTSYRTSLLNLALKPLVGAVAALVLYTLLSWNVVKGLEVTNPGVFLLAAFLAGFSERYFLKVVWAAENEPHGSTSAKSRPEQGHEIGP